MCRLLAVSCSQNVDISYSMRRFRDLVYDDPVLPRGNEDCWGIAIWNPKWKMKDDKREDFASETHWMEVYRSENSVSDDSLRYDFYQNNVRAGTYLLHVRFISKTSESTKGGLDPRLSHPYFFKLGDFCLAFAHNGTIHDKEQLLKKSKSFTLPKADRIKQGRYTDSEAAFCYFISRLIDEASHQSRQIGNTEVEPLNLSDQSEIAPIVETIAAEIIEISKQKGESLRTGDKTKFHFILLINDTIYAYRDGQTSDDAKLHLYYVIREKKGLNGDKYKGLLGSDIENYETAIIVTSLYDY